MQTKSVSKSIPVSYPDAVDECSFAFVRQGGAWFCQVTSSQGMKQYPLGGNVTGPEATALASAASKFLALYQADVNAGGV